MQSVGLQPKMTTDNDDDEQRRHQFNTTSGLLSHPRLHQIPLEVLTVL